MEEVPRTRKKEVLSSHHVESSRPSLTTVRVEVQQVSVQASKGDHVFIGYVYIGGKKVEGKKNDFFFFSSSELQSTLDTSVLVIDCRSELLYEDGFHDLEPVEIWFMV